MPLESEAVGAKRPKVVIVHVPVIWGRFQVALPAYTPALSETNDRRRNDAATRSRSRVESIAS